MSTHIKQPNPISINSCEQHDPHEKATWLPSVVWHCFLLLLVMAIALQMPVANAQTVGLGTDISGLSTDSLTAAAGSDDLSKSMLGSVLGKSFVEAPLVPNPTRSTIGGAVFFSFNAVIFILGSGIGLWFLITQIIESAQAGEVLGKNVSGWWAPIRGGIGLFGMLPAFGGFSLAQAVMMTIIIWGIGGGNITETSALDYLGQGVQLVAAYDPASPSPSLTNDINNVVQGAFALEICADAFNYSAKSQSAGLPYNEIRAQSVTLPGGGGIRYSFGPCGYVQLTNRGQGLAASQDDASGLRKESSWSSFRIASVNYDGVAKAVHQAAQNALGSAVLQTMALADDMYSRYASYAYGSLSAHPDADPNTFSNITTNTMATLAAIEQSVTGDFEAGLSSAAGNAEPTTNQAAIDKLKQGGWIKYGLLSSTFWEESAAVADAQHAFQFTYYPTFAHADDQYVIDAMTYWHLANTNNAQGAIAKKSNEGIVDMIKDMVLPSKNATSNRSFGQWMVNELTSGFAADSGGYGLVNPIVVSKNMGDWMLDIGGVFLAADYGAHGAEALGMGNPASRLVLKYIGNKVGAGLEALAYGLIGVGAILSYYIPFIPIECWIAAVLAWLLVVFEALVSAQVAMLMHLDMRQNGLGGGAGGRFYFYALNAFLRPMLTIIGYTAGMALSIVIGTYILSIFPALIAALQGNSDTGVFAIGALTLIFFVLIFTSTKHCYSFTHELPDRFMGWVGQHTSDRTTGLFMAKTAKDAMGGTSPSGTVAGSAAKGTPVGMDLKATSTAAAKGLL